MTLPPFHLHLDVVALVVGLEALYLLAVTRLRPQVPGAPAASPRQLLWFTLGMLSIGAVSVWPVHDVAEDQLLSVHMTQHLVISMVAPPLLLLGMPPWLLRRVLAPLPLRWTVRHLARPVAALVLFNTVIVLSHWPVVVDLTLGSELAHFLAHAVLFGSALLMWWPVVDPLPEMPGLSYPGRMLYLFLQSIVPTVPASFLTFGSSVIYRAYAEAGRVFGIDALGDQRVAGLIMKLVGGAILWAVIAGIFFRWFAQEQRSEGWDALEWRELGRDVRSQLSKR
ncbi:MAG TPA: cytochrome c oxidase assembly protein [Actinomycetota bacterium]|nr:cytochrome c oxidase assembly protein [Actinomycetota bacterium]